MATLTVSSGDYLRPFRGNIRCNSAPEGASQTFVLGVPLIFSSTASHENEVITCGSDPTSGLLGVAAQAASGTQGTAISFWIADTDAEFIGRVQDGGTLDYTDVGAARGLVYDGTNHIWRVDLSETTSTNVRVTSLVDHDGDINGRVSFQFIAAARVPFSG